MKIYFLLLSIFIALQWLLPLSQKQERVQIFVSPSKNIKNFTFGYNDFLSSLLWVRVVQDLHVCDQNSEKTVYPKFENTKDPLSEIIHRELPAATCENGWVYQMLDVISELEPGFKSVYVDGATMLSVVVDDRKGASLIFKKGRKVFPDSWRLFYRSAYHELFEMQNPKEAQELMLKAAKLGAPKWVYSLAAKLFTRSGQAAFAKTVLESILARDHAGKYKKRLENQLNEVNKVLREAQ